MSKNEKVLEFRQLSVPAGLPKNYILDALPISQRVGIHIHGSFISEFPQHNVTNLNYLYVSVQILMPDKKNNNSDGVIITDNVTDVWRLSVINDIDQLDRSQEVQRKHVFSIGDYNLNKLRHQNATMRLKMETNFDSIFPINLAYDSMPIDTKVGVMYAAVILLGLYILIIWEIVHRTFAAIIASTLSIGVLAALNERPTMPELMSWIDVETLLLLFGMMILVAILSETGIFDYLAVYAYKVRFVN